MLAGSSGIPRDPTGWIFEPKWDGVRAVGRAWSGRLKLSSRRGNDITAAYPELAPLAGALGDHAAVVDGEVIAFDARGRPSFERLQRRMHVRRPAPGLVADVPVLYVLFDLLWLDGRSLVDEPLTERRRALDALALKGPSWQTSPVIDGVPDADLLAACREVGLEGYVGKEARSTYQAGRRSRSWTKIKCIRRREFVVGGWTDGSGGRGGAIGSLAVGWVDPDLAAPPGLPFALRYSGQVGSGLGEEMLRTLAAAFRTLATDACPFVAPPALPREVHFVRPELVVEVAFTEMTTSGSLRQPSIKGLRDDVAPADVGWDEELAR